MVRVRTLGMGSAAALLALLLAGAGCNDGQLVGGIDADGPGEESTPPGDGDGDGDGDGGSDDGDTGTWDPDGPQPIPDDDKHIPCKDIWMEVWNQDVAAATVALNGEELIGTDWFPTDEVWLEFINPLPGWNVLDVGGRLYGAPDDLLHFHVEDLERVIYLHDTVVRDAGAPNSETLEFYVEADCEDDG